MADTDYSSLRSAIERIMGTTPGGSTSATESATTAGTSGAPGEITLASPGGTSAEVTNSPEAYDPYAADKAQLEAIQAETAALQAQMGGGTTDAAASTATQVLPSNLGGQENAYKEAMARGADSSQLAMIANYPGSYLQERSNLGSQESAYKEAMAMGATTSQLDMIANIPGSYLLGASPSGAAAAPAAASSALTKPVNPGPSAPWQASAQYWKDLEAYRKGGGV